MSTRTVAGVRRSLGYHDTPPLHEDPTPPTPNSGERGSPNEPTEVLARGSRMERIFRETSQALFNTCMTCAGICSLTEGIIFFRGDALERDGHTGFLFLTTTVRNVCAIVSGVTLGLGLGAAKIARVFQRRNERRAVELAERRDERQSGTSRRVSGVFLDTLGSVLERFSRRR